MKINLTEYNPLADIFKLLSEPNYDATEIHLLLLKAGIYADNIKELKKIVALLEETYKEVNGQG